MATIHITEHELHVRLSAVDKLLALRMEVKVPLAHVTGVRARPSEAVFDVSIHERSDGRGLLIPGRVALGTILLDDGLSFFEVRDPSRAIAIDLDASQEFRHLIIELDSEDPVTMETWIAKVLAKYRAHGSWRDVETPLIDDLSVDTGATAVTEGVRAAARDEPRA